MRHGKPILALLATSAALIAVGGGVLLRWQGRDTTIYAAQFNEEKFHHLKPGMTLQNVYSLLGQPLTIRRESSPERWCYGKNSMRREGGRYVLENLAPPDCVLLADSGTVLGVTGKIAGVEKGMSSKEVLTRLGPPRRRMPASALSLHYTAPGGEGLFRGRIVAVDARRRVSDVISYQFYD